MAIRSDSVGAIGVLQDLTEITEIAGEPTPLGFVGWVTKLVHQHRALLLALARRKGLAAEDALDAVQDSFMSFLRLPAARSIANVPEDSLKLLTTILRHDILNRRRKYVRRAHTEITHEIEQPDIATLSNEELVLKAEELARVHGCIMKLAQLQRDVVMLSLVDEQPREEVARLLGISDAHVRVLIHRARVHIRSCNFDAERLTEAQNDVA